MNDRFFQLSVYKMVKRPSYKNIFFNKKGINCGTHLLL